MEPAEFEKESKAGAVEEGDARAAHVPPCKPAISQAEGPTTPAEEVGEQRPTAAVSRESALAGEVSGSEERRRNRKWNAQIRVQAAKN